MTNSIIDEVLDDLDKAFGRTQQKISRIMNANTRSATGESNDRAYTESSDKPFEQQGKGMRNE